MDKYCVTLSSVQSFWHHFHTRSANSRFCLYTILRSLQNISVKMFNIPIMTMAAMGLVAPSYAALAVPYNGDHSMYRCLTTERFESFNPSCIRQCEDMALKSGADGCQKVCSSTDSD